MKKREWLILCTACLSVIAGALLILWHEHSPEPEPGRPVASRAADPARMVTATTITGGGVSLWDGATGLDDLPAACTTGTAFTSGEGVLFLREPDPQPYWSFTKDTLSFTSADGEKRWSQKFKTYKREEAVTCPECKLAGLTSRTYPGLSSPMWYHRWKCPLRDAKNEQTGMLVACSNGHLWRIVWGPEGCDLCKVRRW